LINFNFIERGVNMNAKTLAIMGTLAVLMSNMAMATEVPLSTVPVPIEDGGLLAVAAACLAVGIRIARRKRNR